ncbi:MAG: hypothetical protein WCS70_15075, partial [Verrucomicrobiota bacterium]
MSNRSSNEIFRDYAARRLCVWLDTATGPGQSLFAADPFQIVRAHGRRVEIITPAGTRVVDGDPFAVLKTELARFSCREGEAPAEPSGKRRGSAGASPSRKTTGAAIGYFGYGLKNFVENLPARAVDDIGLPDLWFGFYKDIEVGRGAPPSRAVVPQAARWDSAPY